MSLHKNVSFLRKPHVHENVGYSLSRNCHNFHKMFFFLIFEISYTKPSIRPKFILHILLSLERFQIEHQLLLKESLRDCLCKAKWIGKNNNKKSLSHYSNKILNLFIRKQVKFFPNSIRVIDDFIILVGDLFNSVIFENNIPITEIPAV